MHEVPVVVVCSTEIIHWLALLPHIREVSSMHLRRHEVSLFHKISRLMHVIAIMSKLLATSTEWTFTSMHITHANGILFELEGLEIILHCFGDDSLSRFIESLLGHRDSCVLNILLVKE